MKKLFLIMVILVFSSVANAAITLHLLPKKEHCALVSKVGYRILNENRIPYKMTFAVANNKQPNASTYYKNNRIVVNSPLIEILDTEDELAYIIAHEISHGVDYRQGILKGYFTNIITTLGSKKYEYKADKRALDYLVRAGYNPVAAIVALNKIAPQARFDCFSFHPLTTRRMAEIYEYIYTKYPQYLVENEYKDNMVYQNFLLTSRENRQKLEKKINSNSRRKVKYQ